MEIAAAAKCLPLKHITAHIHMTHPAIDNGIEALLASVSFCASPKEETKFDERENTNTFCVYVIRWFWFWVKRGSIVYISNTHWHAECVTHGWFSLARHSIENRFIPIHHRHALFARCTYLKIGDLCESFEMVPFQLSVRPTARTEFVSSAPSASSSSSAAPHDYGYCWCVSVFRSIWLNSSICI